MTCSNPRPAFLFDDGSERAISFKPVTDWMAAFTRSIDLPCRKCITCRADEALVWTIRAHHEAQMHKQNSMVTLTFDDEHLPPAISKKHLQDFFKRLRHTAKFRYIACGEYGGLTRRPHYHVLFFGQDFLGGAHPSISGRIESPIIKRAWPFGMNDVVPVEFASIAYVCGYATKKLSDPDTFKLQSGGIGHGWLDKYADDIARTGHVVINGQTFPVPKRYLEWEPEFLAHVKDAREEYARKRVITPEGRLARRLIAEKRAKEARIKETRR